MTEVRNFSAESRTEKGMGKKLARLLVIFELKALPAAAIALIILKFMGDLPAVRFVAWTALLAWVMVNFGSAISDWSDLGRPNIVALIMGACLISPFALVYALL